MKFSFVVCVSLALCGTIFGQINPQLNAQFRAGQVPGQIGMTGQIPGQLGTQFNQFGMVPGQLGVNQFGSTFPGTFNQFGNQFGTGFGNQFGNQLGMGINNQLGRGPSLVPSGQMGGFGATNFGFNQFGTTGFNSPLGSPFGNQFGTGFNQFGQTGFNNGLNTFNRLGQPNMVGQFPGQMNQFNTLNPGLRQPVGKIAK